MALNAKRKLAMLLMSLDPDTAKELLVEYPVDFVQEIGVEMAKLDAAGKRDGGDFIKIMEDFCLGLEKQKNGGMHVRTFLNDMISTLENSHIQKDPNDIDAFNQKDPFFAICSTSPEIIAKAIMHERPQIVALILSALPAKTATEVMAALDQETNRQVACKMALPGDIAPKTRHRIGEMVLRRINELNSQDDTSKSDEPTENLRKVAMVLSGLEQEARDSLIEAVSEKDSEIARTIKALMVTWEDIPRIYDRSLQEALRSVEPGILAKALFGASETIIDKIRANISERAAESLDEEISLMQDPLKKEILEAREQVINPLRDANENGQLRFIEG